MGTYKISLLIAIGCFTGLRISDILALRWKQILDVTEFTITERKTGKQRTIRLNKELQEHIKDCYEHIQPLGIAAPILVSQKGTVFTVHASTNTERTQIQIQVEDKAFQLPQFKKDIW